MPWYAIGALAVSSIWALHDSWALIRNARNLSYGPWTITSVSFAWTCVIAILIAGRSAS